MPWPVPFAPRAEAGDDRAGSDDVERYEQLRRQALRGDASGWRLGLALLQRRGVAAWASAWQPTAPATPARATTVAPVVEGDGVVGVLAAMALACLRAG